MADISSLLNELLRKHNTHINTVPRKRSQTTDEFLKEAYRINAHISSLHTYLRSIRAPYLSTAPPSHRNLHSSQPTRKTPSASSERTYLTDTQRSSIDDSSKSLLRDLNASIRQLADAEQLRQSTALSLAARNRGHAAGIAGAMGRWAAGGDEKKAKSPEDGVEEARMQTVKVHRESVIWYLRRKLEAAGEVQKGMMERRVEREVEKSRSVLYMTRGFVEPPLEKNGTIGAMNGDMNGRVEKGRGRRKVNAAMDEEGRREAEQQLSPEQLQLFAKENSDMLRHYEDTLDQVRTAERSLLEISSLQTTLAANLDSQSANISQLVADSLNTSENVGSGNKELKRATERKSTARMVFWASCGLCGVLVVWDLVF